ncbi:hypothetical protein KFL_004480090 [Klebsormidium nitens]|uniref:Uncharacterized protein n=1 Tax=Klebsormidium nitens TaxID=105231 RepID=A0A1Y1IF68_KLENI|nr:hypothetical protein KFL_004480090 [Klebsormidium nitens]|eukprot:GAQ88652.1 hypothetical protein KFL_004480090 [Klebsormidium nitens]
MADLGLDSQGDRWGMEEEIDYGDDPFELPETLLAEQPAGEEKTHPAVKAAGGRNVLAGSKIDLSGKGEVRSRRDRDRGVDDGRRDRENAGREGRKEGERKGGERREAERQEDERREGERERRHRHKHRSRREDHVPQDEPDRRPKAAEPRSFPEDEAPRSSREGHRSRRSRDDPSGDAPVLGRPNENSVGLPRERALSPKERKESALVELMDEVREERERKNRKEGDVNGRGARWDQTAADRGGESKPYKVSREITEDSKKGYDRDERGGSARYGRYEERVGFDGGREDARRGGRLSPGADYHERRGRMSPGMGPRDEFKREDRARIHKRPEEDKGWEDDKRWEDKRGGDFRREEGRGPKDERRVRGEDEAWQGRGRDERRRGRGGEREGDRGEYDDRRWGNKEDDKLGGHRRDEGRGFREDEAGYHNGKGRPDFRGEHFRGRGPFRQEEDPPRRGAGDSLRSPGGERSPPRREYNEPGTDRGFDRKAPPEAKRRSVSPPPKRRARTPTLEGSIAGEGGRRQEGLEPSPRSRKVHREATFDNGVPADEVPPRRSRKRSLSPPPKSRSARDGSVRDGDRHRSVSRDHASTRGNVDDFEYERERRRARRGDTEERESKAPPRSPIDDHRGPRFEPGRSPIRPPIQLQGGPPIFREGPEGGLHEKGRGRGGFMGMDMGPRWRGGEFPRGRGGGYPPFSPGFAPPQFGGPPRPFPRPEFGPGPLPFVPRGQFPEGGFGRGGWRGPPRHEMEGDLLPPPMGGLPGPEWERRGGPWERNEPWGGDQPRREFPPHFEMGAERREAEGEGRPARKAPVAAKGGERKAEEKVVPAPPKREGRKGGTAMAAVKAMAGALQVSRTLAGEALFEEYKKLLPLSVAMKKGATIAEKSAVSLEDDSDSAGGEERLQALGLADELPRGTFEAALKLLEDSDAHGVVQASAVGCFVLPEALRDIKLGPKPALSLFSETVTANGLANGNEMLDREGDSQRESDEKPGSGAKEVGKGDEGKGPDNPNAKTREGTEGFGSRANGQVESLGEHETRTSKEERLEGDEEDVDYGNLDVGLEDEVDYEMEEDEGLGGVKRTGSNGVPLLEDEGLDDEGSDPELDIVLGRRIASLIGAESRSKAARDASMKSVGRTEDEEGPQDEDFEGPRGVLGDAKKKGEEAAGKSSELGRQGPSATGGESVRSTQRPIA